VQQQIEHRDAGPLECRQVRAHLVFQRHIPLLDEHQCRHRGQRLGHRKDAKQRVLAHGLASDCIAPACPPGQHDSTSALHAQHRARNAAAVDVVVERLA
jgi:hypothetical protein